MNALPRRFALVGGGMPTGPVNVRLSAFWKSAPVVADVSFEFTGFRQLTGSCVGVSEGNAIFTVGAVQRNIATSPTVAFVPWWPFPYGRTRYNEGDRGQGEGAIDSVMVKTLINEGVFGIKEKPDLPTFDTSDGLALPSRTELQWSDGNAAIVKACSDIARIHPLGTAAPVRSTEEMALAIINGYPILDGCDNYIGHGSIEKGVAIGRYDGRGGHSTCYLDVMDHPDLGRLFLYSNQWSGSTYPNDETGKPRCSVWVKEAEVAKLFRTGGDGETFALSHLNYFPAQPAVMLWTI